MYILKLEEFEDADYRWLIKAVQENEFGWTPSLVLKELGEDRARFWRVDLEKARGCIITCLSEHPRGLSLDIWWMAGAGIHRYGRQIKDRLEMYAREKNCFGICGVVDEKHKLFNWYPDEFGAIPVRTTFVRELS